MVPFINQVLHAILRGLAVGTAVMLRSLRNLDVRVWGTSQAWHVQGKTSLETCRRCPSHSRSDAWSRDRHRSCDHTITVFCSGLIQDFCIIHLTF
jgi:hypothetical protein